MTPILFITIAIIVLSLLIYRVLSTMKDQRSGSSNAYNFRHAYNFEIAPELGAYPEMEIHVDPNTIKLLGQDAAHLKAHWNLEQNLLDEVAQETGLQIDPSSDLFLRLYESSDLLRYHDLHITNMKGRCKLVLHPLNAYYISLGIMDNRRFIPILTSNTVIKQR